MVFVDDDAEANFLHFAIQKLHWSPSELQEWLDSDQTMKAAYYASTDLKATHDKEESDKIKRSGRGNKRKR